MPRSSSRGLCEPAPSVFAGLGFEKGQQMKHVVIISAFAALAGSLAACDRASGPANESAVAAASAGQTRAVEETNAGFLAATEAKDVAKAKTYYAPDALMVLPGYSPFKGIDAISAVYDGIGKDSAGKFDANNESVVVSGDMAYAQGTYTNSYTDSETNRVTNDQGYYLVVYRKQADGSWKIVQDVSSPTPAAS